MNAQNASKIKTLHKTLISPAIIIITIIHLAKHVARMLMHYLKIRMAILVSTDVTDNQVEMLRTELSLLVD